MLFRRNSTYKNHPPRNITITHPHTYAEETFAPPEIVFSISDALGSVSLDSIPDFVLCAGQEAARNRSASRASRNSFLDDEDTHESTPVTASSETAPCSPYGKDIQVTTSDAITPVVIRHPLSSARPASLERPLSWVLLGSRPASIASSTVCGSSRKHFRRKAVFRRFVVAWKRVTASTRRLIRIGLDGRASRVPSGFEIVDTRTSWWRRNSSRRRKEVPTACSEPFKRRPLIGPEMATCSGLTPA
ncbi:hypothetical protein EW145_g4511 [Phellinidium pouzarii]|uniref:Uncharacterized protein n=1 Tax=Phellinidium pouzarii TaxID=167371 RepID=A0A4S4L848_9AGAM|nr:hypothetical protein EW145_g4511 [Phellinidium pouzarii]